jgi:hypothetical protein
MKKLFFITALTTIVSSAFAQQLAQVILSNYGNSNYVSFLVDENIIVNVTLDGKIIQWGTENTLRSQYAYNYPPTLDKYMGREEYYPATADGGSRGKVKYIGRTAFTYYSSDENEKWTGKIKSIGPTLIDYYASYEDTALRGNIKKAGSLAFTYFTSYDDVLFKGRLKSVGNTDITYYSSFDDKAFRGKVKSVGRELYVYYSSYDSRDYGGALKSGNRLSHFGGVKFFVIN